MGDTMTREERTARAWDAFVGTLIARLRTMDPRGVSRSTLVNLGSAVTAFDRAGFVMSRPPQWSRMTWGEYLDYAVECAGRDRGQADGA